MADLNSIYSPIVVSHNDGVSISVPKSAIPYVHVAGEDSSFNRGWDAAETSRLNQAHWESVSGSDDINQDLMMDLPTLQKRCRHESINNPTIDGLIETQQTNVVGKTGPALQVMTDDANFNDAVEGIWAEWTEWCEYQESLSLTDLLHGWVAQYVTTGEILCQEMIGSTLENYRLHDIGAESINTQKLAANIFGGIETDDRSRVTGIYVHDLGNPLSERRLPIEYTLHGYRRRFAMQRRAIPPLASGLQPAADGRDYDDQVMDAARAAADQSLWMVSDHDDAPFQTVPKGTQTSIKRRVVQHAAPGWKPFQLEAHQPMVQYVPFRMEKQRDMGSPIEMPLMILRRDASNHNMSSARFDGSRYAESIKRFQTWLERRTLNKILRRLVRLAQFEGILKPTPRSKLSKLIGREFGNSALKFSFTWPKMPPVDVVKDAMAQRIRMENGTLSYSDACAEEGARSDQVMAKRKFDNERLVENGLPPVMGPMPTPIADYGALLSSLEVDDEPGVPAAPAE